MKSTFLEKVEKISKLFAKVAWIEVSKVLVVAVLTCFFVVPGIWCMVNFAFTELISFESPNLDTKGVFMLSKELATGRRKKIFLQILSAWGNIFAVGILMFVILFVFNLFLPVSGLLYLIFVPLAIFVAGFFILKVSLLDIFLQAKKEKVLQAVRL